VSKQYVWTTAYKYWVLVVIIGGMTSAGAWTGCHAGDITTVAETYLHMYRHRGLF